MPVDGFLTQTNIDFPKRCFLNHLSDTINPKSQLPFAKPQNATKDVLVVTDGEVAEGFVQGFQGPNRIVPLCNALTLIESPHDPKHTPVPITSYNIDRRKLNPRVLPELAPQKPKTKNLNP